MISAADVLAALRYDPETGRVYWVAPSKYHSGKVGSEAGCVQHNRSGKSYYVIKLGGRHHKRARIAWVLMKGRWPDLLIDHANGDSLDDRWLNLREATVQQNAWNHKSRKKATGLPMGVRRNARGGSFGARITVNKVQHHLGAFATPEEASAAYQAARKVYYGEFA